MRSVLILFLGNLIKTGELILDIDCHEIWASATTVTELTDSPN